MKFLEVGFSNFLSYGNNLTTIKLDFNDSILIVGKNFDSVVDGQVDSNGAGKSTILNAVTYCAYDKTVSRIDKNDLINDINLKNMYVYIIFEKNGSFYKIERYRKNKKMGGDGVKLSVNTVNAFDEEHDVTPDSVGNANKAIEKIIGIPFEMFARIVVFTASYEPFLSLPSHHASKTNQRDIIEELFGYTEVSEWAEALKSQMTETKRLISDLSILNTQIEKETARYNDLRSSYITKSDDWVEQQDSKRRHESARFSALSKLDLDGNLALLNRIKKVENDNNVLHQEIRDVEREISEIEKNVALANSWSLSQMDRIGEATLKMQKLNGINFDEQQELNSQLVTHRAELIALKDQLRELNQSIDSNNSIIANNQKQITSLSNNTCPYCNQEYLESVRKLQECIKLMESAKTQVALDSSLRDRTAYLVGDMQELIDGITSRVLYDTATLSRLEHELESIGNRINELKNETNPYEINIISDVEMSGKRADLDQLNELASKQRSKIDALMVKLDNGIKTESDIYAKRNELSQAELNIRSIDSAVNPYTVMIAEIDGLEFDKSKIDEINEADVLYRHQDFLHKLLTKKDSFIRKALLNKRLPFLNERLNSYLGRIGLPHKVTFTEEMEAKISRFDIDIPFENLSSGQKARVNIALSFAFRDVLESRFEKINLCMLDECLDTGLGNVGVQLAASMIKDMARKNELSMFVISHRDEVSSMFKNQMEVHLRNGFSEIIVQ